jgi:hypothetical protein
MREAIGEDIEPRLRGMLQGHAEAATDEPPGTAAAPRPKRPPRVAPPEPEPEE